VARPSGKIEVICLAEEFRRYVENDLMKREPHPDAKPLGAFPIGRGVA